MFLRFNHNIREVNQNADHVNQERQKRFLYDFERVVLLQQKHFDKFVAKNDWVLFDCQELIEICQVFVDPLHFDDSYLNWLQFLYWRLNYFQLLQYPLGLEPRFDHCLKIFLQTANLPFRVLSRFGTKNQVLIAFVPLDVCHCFRHLCAHKRVLEELVDSG